MIKQALYKKGETDFVGYVVEVDGVLVTEYSNEPIQGFLDNGYELVPESKLWGLLSAAQIEQCVTGWEEISEDRYWELLEALPPEKWESGMFRMCEYTCGEITLHVAKVKGLYFAAEKPITDTYDEYLLEISNSIKLGGVKG